MCTWYFLKIEKISSQREKNNLSQSQKLVPTKQKNGQSAKVNSRKNSLHTVDKYYTTLPDWLIK